MNLIIYFNNEQEDILVNGDLEALVEKSIKGVLAHESFNHDCEVSVTFTNNEKIHKINKEYRFVDRPTDVLSFPMYDFYAGETPNYKHAVELGDIVLSLEKAKEQSIDFGHSFEREVSFLTVHSVLHLLGYDHERSLKDEKIMFEKQDKIMEEINILR